MPLKLSAREASNPGRHHVGISGRLYFGMVVDIISERMGNFPRNQHAVFLLLKISTAAFPLRTRGHYHRLRIPPKTATSKSETPMISVVSAAAASSCPLIPTALKTDTCPISGSDRDNSSWVVGNEVPRFLSGFALRLVGSQIRLLNLLPRR